MLTIYSSFNSYSILIIFISFTNTLYYSIKYYK